MADELREALDRYMRAMKRDSRKTPNWTDEYSDAREALEAAYDAALSQAPDGAVDFYAGRYAERCGDVLALQADNARLVAALKAIAGYWEDEGLRMRTAGDLMAEEATVALAAHRKGEDPADD